MCLTPTVPVDCVFCKIVGGSLPARIVRETAHSMALLDAFPLASGHVLVIPRKHHQMIQDMSAEENADLFSVVHSLLPRMEGTLAGATLVAVHNGRAAGQAIPHIHVHLVPRSEGDGAGAIHDMFDPRPELSPSETDRVHELLRDG